MSEISLLKKFPLFLFLVFQRFKFLSVRMLSSSFLKTYEHDIFQKNFFYKKN